ncbi:DEAD/DEAH box helicase [Flavobacterium anhuiense]|uniref:DEAD/DEAH box helicase n=1 Tax=Flavobacterium anhuiense TaxID=459526 RepID=UPI003D9994A7
MINQNNREDIIKLLDHDAEEVNIKDLFLYDLSPYYQEKKDESFFSKQIEFILEKNTINHSGRNISFTDEQKKLYDQIAQNGRVLISAPTSFGKTMLIKEYIFNEQPKRIVFLVPTNSLADELVEDFNMIFRSCGYTIFDTLKSGSAIADKSIFIGTQEKYYQIYGEYKDKIDLFVIDEAYKLGDRISSSREVILNRAFIDTLRISDKTVLLLPLVNKISGLEDLEFRMCRSEYAPVAKNFKSEADFSGMILEKVHNSGESNLIYFNTPNDAEKFFMTNLKENKAEALLSDSWVQRVESDFHPEWIPIKALKAGIGIHYGPMPKFMQKKVIDLFNNGLVRTLLATSSVIEGVNTPTKNIFITTAKDIMGSKNIIKFKNLIGRAGRLGIHKVGNVFYKQKHQPYFELCNVPYSAMSLDFLIKDQAQVIEINREEEYKSAYLKGAADNDLDQSYKEKTKIQLEDSYHGKIPLEAISQLLNKYGFTITQYTDLLEFVRRPDMNLFKVLAKLKSLDTTNVNNNSLYTILSPKYRTIPEIVVALKTNVHFSKMEISHIVSVVIKMIYNVIPYKVIPAIEFIIELDDLLIRYNGRRLVSGVIIRDAHRNKVMFLNKFIGENSVNIEESKKVMTKLFEYGIPYSRVRRHINEIVERVPENFSAYDIKKIINETESMTDLRIYFE